MGHKYRFKSFKEFFSWAYDRWYMPKEFRNGLALNTLHNLIIIMQMVFLFGVGNILLYAQSNIHNLHSAVMQEKLFYYGHFIMLSITVIVFSLILIKINCKKYLVNLIPIFCTFLVLMYLVAYNFIRVDAYFNGTILYFCTGIVTVTFFSVSPVILVVFTIFVNSHVGLFVLEEWGRRGFVDFQVFTILLIFLSLFKWRVTKRDLIRNEMLSTHKEILSEEIQRKTQELQSQHEKIVEIQNNTIISLSNLVENRDSDTGEHIRRTSAYVRLLAQKALTNGVYTDIITPEFIDTLTKAAPMHDIGKIVVPDSVLKKPGKLTEEEFAEIRRHTTEGGRIVKEVIGEHEDQDYVRIAIEVATSHHERWDGKGYPYHLAGDAIPLSARIMAIADVYDALVSPRCYKEPFTVEKAVEIIKEGSGTHFDPKLTELFLDMIDDVVAVMERYKE